MLKFSRRFFSAIAAVGLVASLVSGALAQTSDAMAPSSLGGSVTYSMCYNGSTWDRCRSALGTTGILAINTESTKASYSASLRQVIAGATTNEFCFLNGSASKTIRVSRVEYHLAATAAAAVNVNLVRRSTANSGGTCSTPAIAKHDSTNAAASSVFTGCTDSSGQTPGTTAGTISADFVVNATGTTDATLPRVFLFGADNAQTIVLRGVAESLNISYAGAAPGAGTTAYCRFQWTEE